VNEPLIRCPLRDGDNLGIGVRSRRLHNLIDNRFCT